MDAKMCGSPAVRLRKLLFVGICGLTGCVMLISADPLRIGVSAAQQPGETGNQLTVERIYSAPSLSGRILRDTVWSPDGKLLTYLDDGGGRPEIWAVDATTGRRHVLVDAGHLRDVLLPPESRGQQTGLGRLSPTRYLGLQTARLWFCLSTGTLLVRPDEPVREKARWRNERPRFRGRKRGYR